MKPLSYPRALTLTLLLGTLALSGCSPLTSNTIGISNPVDNPTVTGPSIKGSVFGGHAAIVGSHVYVLQPSTTGIGTEASSLLTSGTGRTKNTSDPTIPTSWYYVTTASDGSFNITGDYTCKANQPVYLYAYGGSSVNSTTNPGIVLLATLGDCPSAAPLNFGSGSSDPLSFVYMNEVSTVATAYAFQGFTKPATSTTVGNSAIYIGSSDSAQGLLGIENAANTAGELYNIQGANIGTAPEGEDHIASPTTVNGNGTVPQALLDTLANILAGCVDSNNTTTHSNTACTNLFNAATSDGTVYTTSSSIVPTDIATAAINIARHPAGVGQTNFVSTIYGLQTGTVPFTPNLGTQPNDFTVGILYSAANNTASPVTSAESIAVDENGYVWITAQGSTDTFRWDSQGKLNSNVTSNGYIYGYVSIDGNNNAWTGNAASTSGIQEFDADGTATSVYGSGDYTTAYTVITDNAGDVFFGASSNPHPTNTGGKQDLFEYTAADVTAGTSSNPSFYSLASSLSGDNIVSHGAIDASADLWLVSENGESISRVNSAGVPATYTYTYTYNCGTFSNPFKTCTGTATATNFPISTPTVSGAKYQPQPEFPAIDGSGNAWIPIQTTYSPTSGTTYSNFTPGVEVVSPDGSTVTQLYSGSYPSSNNCHTHCYPDPSSTVVYTGANFYQSFGAAVDGNGNVWITNRYNSGLGGTNTAGNGNSTLIELNGSTYAAISPSTNYIPETGTGATPILNDSLNLAIDPSGNIWITNYTGNAIVEVVGAAAPVVTPLSVTAHGGKFGTTP